MVNTKKLQRLMNRAAGLALKHSDAVNAAHAEFERLFGEDLPEEAGFLEVANPREEAASVFNAFLTYGENQSDVPDDNLAEHVAQLMAEREED
jgi:hypothetical protein